MSKRRSARFKGLILLLVVAALAFLWKVLSHPSNYPADGTTVTTEPVPDSGEMIDNTEVGSSTTDPRSEEGNPDLHSPTTPLNGAIIPYFSNTYGNKASIGENDSKNIDRSLSRLINSAKTSIDCALFELESNLIADALLDAHNRGVRVRMVAEEEYRDNEELIRVIEAGIPVVTDGRSGFMHNKFFVVDEETVWTGSFNATDNDAWRNNNNAVMIRSRELAENYETEFEEMFLRHEFGPKSTSNTPHTFFTLSGTDIYNYFSPEDDVRGKVIRFIKAAKERIRFMAFSMTDDEIGSALIERFRAGVDVKGIMETRGSDLPSSELNRFRSVGLSVLTDANRYVMHHKVIVIDGTWTILGSYNFTQNADRTNDENIVIIKNREIARAFEDEFIRVERIKPLDEK